MGKTPDVVGVVASGITQIVSSGSLLFSGSLTSDFCVLFWYFSLCHILY